MTTVVEATPTHAATQTVRRPRFTDLLRSEWIKLMSLGSMRLALLSIFVIGVAGALFLGLTLEATGVPSTPSLEITMMDVTMGTVIIGQITAGIIGVVSIGAEYSSGSIQAMLLAEPTRLRALMAKAVLIFTVLFTTGLATVLTAWAATYPLYAQFGLQASLTGYGVVSSIVGTAGYLGLCAVFGLGLGTLLRSSTAGAILVFFATLLGPALSSLLPHGSVVSKVVRLMLIGNAGDSMSRVTLPDAPFLTLWGGYISPAAGWLLAGSWAVLMLGLGAIVLVRRDA